MSAAEEKDLLSQNAEPGWKNYDDFAEGIDTNRLPNTQDWLTQEVAIEYADGFVMALQFIQGNQNQTLVNWRYKGEQGCDPYEEVCTSEDHYFFDIQFSDMPNESLTLILNSATRRVLAIRSTLLLEEQLSGRSRLVQHFQAGYILGGPVTGIEPEPTRELIGYRTLNVYSPNHYYEHFYVNSERYAWQNLRGEQFGYGDMDYATCYKFEEDMYVFTFRDKIMPVCSVFFFDYVTGRCTGKIMGVTSKGDIQTSRAGAFIHKMSYNCYPTGVAPL
ncbi:MoaF C-terminal domain-containing protein [Serratia aquatilis]|uniref:MoaF C-terminal domain-containing protein n=1 Tax=Serratia aquatilis TaxID=1737515 RepID=A0ABV6EG45_9GAMM